MRIQGADQSELVHGRWIVVPVWISAWTAVVALDVSLDVFRLGVFLTPARSARWMLREWGTFWGIWIVVSLAVPAIVRRYNPDRIGWPRTLVAHALASALMAWTHLALTAPLFHLYDPDPRQPLVVRTADWFTSFMFARNVLIYWVLLGALLAWNYWLRAQARAIEIARVRERAARVELLMTETQLEALRRDLNPHFLFNALNGLSGLVRTGERDVAVEMISRLGRLLRAGLDRNQPALVPLRDEIDTVEEYLAIERLRVGDRMQVEIDLARAVGDALVPSFILQPLVENAVHHGVGRSVAPVGVVVSARVQGELLMIEVADSGPGPTGGEERTGLRNTRRRLALHYGDQAGLEIGQRPSGGTLTRVWLPFEPVAVMECVQ